MEEAAAFWLIHQHKLAADMRNDAPCAQTRREKREGGKARAHLSPRACQPRLCAPAGEVSLASLAGGFWGIGCPQGGRTSALHLPSHTRY